MSGDAQLLLIIAGVHIFGFAAVAVLILPAIREGWGSPPAPPQGSDSDDEGGRGPRLVPKAPPASERPWKSALASPDNAPNVIVVPLVVSACLGVHK